MKAVNFRFSFTLYLEHYVATIIQSCLVLNYLFILLYKYRFSIVFKLLNWCIVWNVEQGMIFNHTDLQSVNIRVGLFECLAEFLTLAKRFQEQQLYLRFYNIHGRVSSWVIFFS